MKQQFGACGMDCTSCPIPTIHTDIASAQHWVNQFQAWNLIGHDEGAQEILAHGPYCEGCYGDRPTHWSPECWILACCIDTKHLDTCAECADFPCGFFGEGFAGEFLAFGESGA